MVPKVSIIVPIYNVEKYLSRSIESIQRQTLRDIEIILVNDGSVDNSLGVCKEYQSKDNRIKVIDKPNGGVSSARNKGLDVATGEYIGFIDPDDWIEPEMYEKLYQQLRVTDADVCMCNYVIEYNGNFTPKLLDIKKDILEGQEIVSDIVANMIGNASLNSGSQTIIGSVCRLVIKRDIIDQNNFKFELGMPLMEDLIFCIQLFLKSKRVTINRNMYYHYMINSNSAVTSYRSNRFDLLMKVYQRLEELLTDANVYPIVKQRLNNRYITMIISVLANEVRRENKKHFKDKISFIKWLCKDAKLKNVLKEANTNNCTIRKKLILGALKKEFAIYLYLYYSFVTRVTSK